jgi:hypothetical protein
MMNKKITLTFTVKIGELSEMLEPFELEFFYHKKVTQNRDILLENMLDYYVSLEMYDAVIIRDEINRK